MSSSRYVSMVLRWCFITYVRYVSATGRSYEDIFKDNEHKNMYNFCVSFNTFAYI